MTLFRRYTSLTTLLLLLLTLGISGCAKPTQGPEPLPEINIGVAPFTQPTQTWQLLAGYIPDNQRLVEPAQLHEFDLAFSDMLMTKTNRIYGGADSRVRCQEIATANHQQSPSTALNYWAAVGQCMQVDFLLVPQMLDIQARTGGEMGTDVPAGVVMDFFLIETKSPRLISRSHFAETQESLSSNLWEFSTWMKRKGKWVTAPQLAQEGMQNAIKELGL